MQLECPLQVALERERHAAQPAPHLAASTRAAPGPGATVPGVNVPYEPALSPELIVDTAGHVAEAATERIVALALSLGPAAHQPEMPGGGVLWLTGPPGSGKTTLASRLAERLAAQDVPVTIVEWTTLRTLVLPAAWATEAAEEIAHRALAYTAKLLADAGRVVVVDATAPRRAWRASLASWSGPLPRCSSSARCTSASIGSARCAGTRSPTPTAVSPSWRLTWRSSTSTRSSPISSSTPRHRSEWTALEDLLGFVRRLLDRAHG